MGCDDRYDYEESAEQIARKKAEEEKEKRHEKLLKNIRQLHIEGKPIPDYLGKWEKMPKGPIVTDSELEELKDRLIGHVTPTIALDPNFVRRLIQTYEMKSAKDESGFVCEEGYVKELPPLGSKVYISNDWDDFELIVVAHLPKGKILAYEAGNIQLDGYGELHELSGDVSRELSQ